MKILKSKINDTQKCRFSQSWGVYIAHDEPDFKDNLVYLSTKSIGWRIVFCDDSAVNVRGSSSRLNGKIKDQIKNSFGLYLGFEPTESFLFGSCNANIVLFWDDNVVVIEKPNLNRISKYRSILEDKLGLNFKESSIEEVPEMFDKAIQQISKYWDS